MADGVVGDGAFVLGGVGEEEGGDGVALRRGWGWWRGEEQGGVRGVAATCVTHLRLWINALLFCTLKYNLFLVSNTTTGTTSLVKTGEKGNRSF